MTASDSVVSVWLGRFESDDALFTYLERDYEPLPPLPAPTPAEPPAPGANGPWLTPEPHDHDAGEPVFAVSPFERDMGQRFDEAFREAEFFPDGLPDLAAALELFTHGEYIAGPAAEAARALLGESAALANAVVLLFGVNAARERAHESAPAAGGPLVFIGVFATGAE